MSDEKRYLRRARCAYSGCFWGFKPTEPLPMTRDVENLLRGDHQGWSGSGDHVMLFDCVTEESEL